MLRRGVLWMYDRTKPIQPEKPAAVQLVRFGFRLHYQHDRISAPALLRKSISKSVMLHAFLHHASLPLMN